jgi:hypothetical protein
MEFFSDRGDRLPGRQPYETRLYRRVVPVKKMQRPASFSQAVRFGRQIVDGRKDAGLLNPKVWRRTR